MYDVLILNGIIVDGSGKEAYKADLAISGDKIVKIGDLKNAEAKQIVDASGKMVTPGFIDPHTHSDLSVLFNPSMENYLQQGVTTTIGGNCGHNYAPMGDDLYRAAIIDMKVPFAAEPSFFEMTKLLLPKEAGVKALKEQYNIDMDWHSLEEYMNAHGIKFRYSNNCVRDWEYNKSVYENAVLPNRELIKGMLALQNDPHFKGIYKRKDFVDFTLIDGSKFEAINSENATKENMCSLLQSFDFDIHKVEKKDIRYITGGWFEEYVYQKICNEYTNVDAKNVALNVSIEKGDDKNELDVIYLDKENKLHIVECKSFVEGQEGIKVLNDALYKAQAIIKSKFGLFVKQHLFTKSVVEKQPQLNRAREFGIDLKDGNEI